MTCFVLVHGGWHGGWCWRDTARVLRARGHEVYAPTLTGLGERSHLAGLPINLDTHLIDVMNVFEYEDLDDVVLVGHSYGGMVIAGVADALASRIRSLVYLDAFVPGDGDSTLSLTTDEFRRFLTEGAARSGGLTVPPIPAAGFNVRTSEQARVDAKCVPHPFATFVQRLRLSGAWRSVPKKSFILATGWSPNPFAAACERLRADPAWTVREADCGHDVMIDLPEELAGLLVELG